MFVTANKNVNIRLNDAQVSSPCAGYIPVDQQVEVIGIKAGQEIDGNSIWYVSSQNQFLWSGGFVPTQDLLDGNAGQGSNIDSDTLTAVYQSAMSELVSKFKFDYDGCLGLGIGENNGSLAIFLFFKAIPDNVIQIYNYRGVQLTINTQQTGNIKASGIYVDQGTSFPMGGTLVDKDNSSPNAFGTRGAFIQISGSGYYLLTCYHVACENLLSKGTTTYGSGGYVKIAAPFSQSTTPSLICPVYEGILDTTHDYAIIDVSAYKDDFENSIPGGGYFKNFYQPDEISSKLTSQQPLFAFGAASGQKVEGKLSQYITKGVNIYYSEEKAPSQEIYGLIRATNSMKLGDSGGPVVDSNNKLLGYIVAVDDDGSGCYIMPVGVLFTNQSITLIPPES